MDVNRHAPNRLKLLLCLAHLRLFLAFVLAAAPLAIIAPPTIFAQEAESGETRVIGAASAAAAVLFNTPENGSYNRIVATGDVNGDGLTDLLFSATAGEGVGRAVLILGSPAGFFTPEGMQEAWSFTSEQAEDGFGLEATAGDYNLDGYADLLISAPFYAPPGVLGRFGRLYMFLGGPQGPSIEPDWTYTGLDQFNAVGSDTAIGDINNDGLPDILTVGGSSVAPLSIWMGNGELPGAEPDQTREPGGISIDLGDFNGDGVLDAFVGNGSEMFTGTVSVYRGVQSSGLSLRPAWVFRGESEFSGFGGALANAGDVNGDGLDDVIVGAPLDGDLGDGRAYLIPGDSRRVRGPVEIEAASLAWNYTGTHTQGRLGSWVAAIGDLNQDGYDDVVVSEPGANRSAGSAHIFLGSANGLGTQPAWTITGEQEGDNFGSVQALGDINDDGHIDFAIAANGLSDPGIGKLYIYHGGPEFGQVLGPDIPEPQSDLTWFPSLERAIEGEAGMAFGWPALIIGDVNGDGYDDLAINSLGNPATPVSGQVSVYYGNERDLSSTPDWVVHGDDWNELLGTSDVAYGGLALGPVGDVNGDGYDDLVLSAIDWSQPRGETALVYYGGPEGLGTGIGAVPDILRYPLEPIEGDDRFIFGATAGPAGDVNGDGYADAAIAAFVESDDSWLLFVYAGSESGLGTEPIWSIGVAGISDQALAFAAAGDTNGDGYDDLLIAAPPREADGPDLPGQATLYLGGADGLADEPAWTLNTGPVEDGVAASIAALGDVNGDGFDDVAVASPIATDDSGDLTGRVQILFGDGENVDNGSPQSLALDLGAMVDFGTVVDAIGDVNGDGYADLLVGSRDFLDRNTIIWQILPGGSQGIGETPLWQVSLLFDEPLLLSVPYYIAGDLNGDGYADVPLSDIDVGGVINGEVATGQAIVYFGGPGMGAQPEPPVDPVDPVEPQDDLGGIEWEPSAIQALPGAANEAFGWPSVIAGDLNGDGYDDVAVSSFGNPEIEMHGRVAIYYGSANGVSDSPDWEVTGESWTAFLDAEGTASAFALGPVGDINGDGYDDLVVTVLSFDSSVAALLVYFGAGDDAGGLSQEPVELAPPYDDNFIFGLRLVPAGDVNGDGYADLALLSFDLQEGELVIWVYHGSADGIEPDPVWTPGTIDFIESSPSFSSAGDINGDGFGDLIVAYADEDQDFRTVRLFLGSADGLATTPAWSWTDDAFNVGGGISVAGLGDVNGDGFDDAAVAVPASTTPDGADGSSGQVIVLLGDGKGLDEGRSHIVRPTLDEGETFGAAIGAAGDVNGDGYADLIATSLSGDGQLRWYLFPGGEQGIRSVPLWIEDTFALDPEFAIFQTIAGGDVNGDGLADLVLSDVDINRIMGGDSTVGQALLLYGAGIPTDGPDGEDVTVDITGAGGITETEDIAGTEDVVTDEPISDSPSAADLEIAEEIEIDVDDTRFLTLSPDGTRLLAERPADRALCIYTAVPLAEEFCVPYRDSMRSVMTSNLSWSPDSRFIVFTEDYYLRLDESDVWRLDVETGQLENLTDDGSEGRSAIFTPEGDVPFDVLPVFAPDGAAILFERSMRSGEVWAGSSLYEMSEATGELTELVQLSEGEQLILLSLDYDAAGDIVYSVYIGGADARNGIWLLPAGETEPSLILTPDEERGPPQVVQVAAGKALLWYGEYAGRFRAPTLPIFEVLDLATGETVALELPNDTIEQSGSVNAILSPDATKVLYAYRSGEQTWRLAVRDLGGDVETVLLERDEVIGWSRARSSGLEWVAGDRIFVAGYTVDRVIELAPR